MRSKGGYAGYWEEQRRGLKTVNKNMAHDTARCRKIIKFTMLPSPGQRHIKVIAVIVLTALREKKTRDSNVREAVRLWKTNYNSRKIESFRHVVHEVDHIPVKGHELPVTCQRVILEHLLVHGVLGHGNEELWRHAQSVKGRNASKSTEEHNLA